MCVLYVKKKYGLSVLKLVGSWSFCFLEQGWQLAKGPTKVQSSLYFTKEMLISKLFDLFLHLARGLPIVSSLSNCYSPSGGLFFLSAASADCC